MRADGKLTERVALIVATVIAAATVVAAECIYRLLLGMTLQALALLNLGWIAATVLAVALIKRPLAIAIATAPLGLVLVFRLLYVLRICPDTDGSEFSCLIF